MQVVVTGFKRHGPHLAQLLNDHAPGVRAAFYHDRRTALLHAAAHTLYADAAISFGGPRPKEILQKICDLRRRPLIMIWAGSDVVTIAEHPAELEYLRLAKIIHWASGPELAGELAGLGIQAKYLPTAFSPIPTTLHPLPSAFTVLTYLPQPRREFYGQRWVWEAARAMSDIRFVAVGTGGPEPGAPPNIEYVGDVTDMEARYNAASVLLRVPEHDSLSQGVVEALAHGRHVVWNDALPGCIRVHSAAQTTAALRALRQAHDEGRLGLNEAGLQYVSSEHDPATVAAGIVTALREAIEETRVAAGEHRGSKVRVAISGHEIFSARIAANSRGHRQGISANVLSVRSRTEAAISMFEILLSDIWYTVAQPVGPRPFELAASLLRKRRILHWLGSDVEAASKNRALVHRLRSPRFVHLAQNEDVADKLRELGLQARVVPLAAVPPVSEVRPLPKDFTLLLYLPADRPEFYGRYQYEQLMQTFSTEAVQYIILGGGRIDVPDGVKAQEVQWAHQLSEIYDRSTAFVRFTDPRFVSLMVIEALLHGRHVLWSNDFPFVRRVRDSHDLERGVRTLLKAHQEGTLTPQFEAARSMRSLYSPEHCLSLLANVCA